jgi:MYXO-CTERM domain-containing protein
MGSFIRRVFLALIACVALVGCSSDGAPEGWGSSSEALSVVATGVDYSFARPSPSGLHAGGYTFAVRYLSPPPNSKNLSKAEADALWAAKVDIVSNFEQGQQNVLGGHAQGVADAKVADSESQAAGMPAGRPIYFSIDFDAQPSEYATIDAYYEGVASVIGLARTGVYAGYYVVKHLFDAGKVKWGWQTYAWSYGNWDNRAQLRQVLNDITAAGDTNCCDKDEAMAGDWGQWHAGPTDACTAFSDGYYCGASPQFSGGTKGHLYHCVGGKIAADTTCAGGCSVEPAGTPDKCAPAPDGGGGEPDAGPSSSGGPGPLPGPGSGDPGSGGNADNPGAGGGSTADPPAPQGGGGSGGGCSTTTASPNDGVLGAAFVALGMVVARRRRRRAE